MPIRSHRQVFLVSRFSLVKFSYSTKFHVVIITESGVFYKGLARNPESGNTPVWVFPNIRRLGWVGDANFSWNVSNEKLLNVVNYQIYSFYYFSFINEKLRGRGGDTLIPPRLTFKCPEILKRAEVDNANSQLNRYLFSIYIESVPIVFTPFKSFGVSTLKVGFWCFNIS